MGIEKWVRITTHDRQIIISVDKDVLNATSRLDECYVIKTDLPQDKLDAKSVHQRYKDLSAVESAFKTMKSDILAVRPLYLRREDRTKGHIIVVMMAYMIIHKLKSLWEYINFTPDEAIKELSILSSVKVMHRGVEITKLMIPDERCKKLLDKANIIWPKLLPRARVCSSE